MLPRASRSQAGLKCPKARDPTTQGAYHALLSGPGAPSRGEISLDTTFEADTTAFMRQAAREAAQEAAGRTIGDSRIQGTETLSRKIVIDMSF